MSTSVEHLDTMPSPEMYSAVLSRFVWTSPWHHDLPSVMGDLTSHLTPTEAAVVPNAFVGVLPLLAKDFDKMRFAATIAAELDFYEASEVVARLASLHDDRDLWRTAADLCGNPAVAEATRQSVLHEVGENPFLKMRIDPTTVPASLEEKRLYQQLWPGAQTSSNSLSGTPTVVVDEQLPPDFALRLAVNLCSAGASISRLSPKADVPLWFGYKTAFVACDSAARRVLAAYPSFPESRILSEAQISAATGTLERLKVIDNVLPEDGKLRLTYIED